MSKRITLGTVLSDTSGVTMIELIVSISILAIVAAPFIGTMISATRNNELSNEITQASMLAQRTMEDLKSRPGLLFDDEKYFSGNSSLLKLYTPAPSDVAFQIKYRVDKVSEGILNRPTPTPAVIPPADDGKVYSSFTSKDINGNYIEMPYQLEFNVESTQLKFNGSYYDLLSKKYFLNINGSGGSYSYILMDEGGTQLQPLNNWLTVDNRIEIKIQFNDTLPGTLEMHVNQDPFLDKEVYFYVVNNKDPSRLLLINDGTGKFFQYDNLIDSPVREYFNRLYQVTVIVEKDGSEVNKLVSNIKK